MNEGMQPKWNRGDSVIVNQGDQKPFRCGYVFWGWLNNTPNSPAILTLKCRPDISTEMPRELICRPAPLYHRAALTFGG